MPDRQRSQVVEVAMEILRFVLGGVGFLVLFVGLLTVGDNVAGDFGALVGLFAFMIVYVGVVMVGECVRDFGGVGGLLAEGRFYLRDLFSRSSRAGKNNWKE